MACNNRLLILGFNATITEPVNADGRVDQFREMELNLHLELKKPLKKLCDDPRTTVVVVSGSHQSVLEKNLEDYNIWLAAQHGVFLRTPNEKWVQNLTDSIHFDWIDSVKFVYWEKGRDVFERLLVDSDWAINNGNWELIVVFTKENRKKPSEMRARERFRGVHMIVEHLLHAILFRPPMEDHTLAVQVIILPPLGGTATLGGIYMILEGLPSLFSFVHQHKTILSKSNLLFPFP